MSTTQRRDKAHANTLVAHVNAQTVKLVKCVIISTMVSQGIQKTCEFEYSGQHRIRSGSTDHCCCCSKALSFSLRCSSSASSNLLSSSLLFLSSCSCLSFLILCSWRRSSSRSSSSLFLFSSACLWRSCSSFLFRSSSSHSRDVGWLTGDSGECGPVLLLLWLFTSRLPSYQRQETKRDEKRKLFEHQVI